LSCKRLVCFIELYFSFWAVFGGENLVDRISD
jgi:hypothetical protein